ncbi:hypothetical protein [Pollutimonas bauzanensis]|uniref:hypothetical protein n=1 Tax=Pollutimonas bauzanensis TaxID=658167 RepID=UPI0011607C1E|nr:hypothetical protein [Pollutimonas bauzanensis]
MTRRGALAYELEIRRPKYRQLTHSTVICDYSKTVSGIERIRPCAATRGGKAGLAAHWHAATDGDDPGRLLAMMHQYDNEKLAVPVPGVVAIDNKRKRCHN